MLHLQKHSNPFLISANTPMTIKPQKHYSVFSIYHFESNFVNPDKYRSENKPKKHVKNGKSSAAFQWTICGARQYFATALTAFAISALVNKAIHKSALISLEKGRA